MDSEQAQESMGNEKEGECGYLTVSKSISLDNKSCLRISLYLFISIQYSFQDIKHFARYSLTLVFERVWSK